VTALEDQSRRPRRSPQRTSRAVTRRVIALREEFGWGGEKLVLLLAEDGIRLAARTIDRIIQREGLTRSDAAPAPALTRFERSAPNELWQMDAKGHYPLRPHGRCHPLSVLDDHSRFAVGLVALAALETDGVQRALIRCFERYGVPAAMLMDHGVPWWASANGGGLTKLSVFLLKQGIRLVYGRVRHPQTQGKVERFHRTLGERLRWWGVPKDLAGFGRVFRRFRQEYNEVRPHEALAMDPPATRFTPSSRAYRPHPARWEYDTDVEVQCVDQTGSLSWKGHRLFVCAALGGEEVGCVRVGRRVLVRYRHMWVRELHPGTGTSVPLLKPVR
jgi:transposase InsO family protein